jgi:hypothetical protein
VVVVVVAAGAGKAVVGRNKDKAGGGRERWWWAGVVGAEDHGRRNTSLSRRQRRARDLDGHNMQLERRGETMVEPDVLARMTMAVNPGGRHWLWAAVAQHAPTAL